MNISNYIYIDYNDLDTEDNKDAFVKSVYDSDTDFWDEMMDKVGYDGDEYLFVKSNLNKGMQFGMEIDMEVGVDSGVILFTQ